MTLAQLRCSRLYVLEPIYLVTSLIRWLWFVYPVDGSTQEVAGGEGDAKVCCLSDEAILKLGTIGVEVSI